MSWESKNAVPAKYARDQGDYAKTQGDVAKNEATNLSQLKTDSQTATTNANTATGAANAAASSANTSKANADVATTNANSATSSANTAASSANTASTNANAQASFATTQGNYAKTQGDYSKAQGDYALSKGDDALSKATIAASKISEATTATTNANNAASSANTAASNATSAASSASSAKDFANTSATSANTAATNANAKAADLEQRFNAAIATTTNSAEVIDARSGKATLKDRIDGLDTQLVQSARQAQTLVHGLSVLNGSVDAPVNIQIDGRTLIPQHNNVLDVTKYYVLADKKTKLKWADASITQGVAKFVGKAERPTLIAIADFETKKSASVLEKPHIAKYSRDQTTLLVPSGFTSEFIQTGDSNFPGYDPLAKLDAALSFCRSTLTNGVYAQTQYGIDVIQEVERRYGRIPRNTLAEKIVWCKTNIAKITFNWHGFGSGPLGDKATVKGFWSGNWTTSGTPSNTTGAVAQCTFTTVNVSSMDFDANGFIFFLAYAEPSDGVTASLLRIDTVNLEIELLPSAILHDPRVPLYEVPQTSYDAILVTWLEDEVLRRYPQVAGVQHIQNPYVMAEGENLIPPFSEWTLHAQATMKSAYELELNATATYQGSSIKVSALPNQSCVFNSVGNGKYTIQSSDINGAYTLLVSTGDTLPKTFTVPSNSVYLLVTATSGSSSSGLITFTNPMLTLGTVAKPFVPRNPSYLFAETKLGALNTGSGFVYDRLYEQDGKYMVRKMIEKDIVLDGSLGWAFSTDFTGYKSLFTTYYATSAGNKAIVTKYNGQILSYEPTASANSMGAADKFIAASASTVISVSDTDTGFGEHYKPSSAAEMQAYFNGWKATGYTAGTAVTAEATGSLLTNATFTFVNNGSYRNVVVTKSTDNVTFTPATEGTDFSIDINGTKAVLKNLNGSTLYFKIDYSYGVTVNAWQSIVDGSNSPTQTSAYVSNVINKLSIYTPYKLSYQLSTPVISEARIEGSISVNGLTQIEVGSGVIVREKVVPAYDSTNKVYRINSNSYPTSALKNIPSKGLSVFKNDVKEGKANIRFSTQSIGGFDAFISDGDYETTSEYYVTYIIYNKQPFTSNVINLLAQYANNIRTALDDTVKKVEDNQTAIAVNTNLIYDILKRLKAGGI